MIQEIVSNSQNIHRVDIPRVYRMHKLTRMKTYSKENFVTDSCNLDAGFKRFKVDYFLGCDLTLTHDINHLTYTR